MAACGGGDESHPAAPAPGAKPATPATAGAPRPAVGTTAPKPASTVKGGGVDLGAAVTTEKTIAKPQKTFAATDTVYVIVRTEGTADFAGLTVHWKDPIEAVTLVAQQTLRPIGPAATEFHYASPRGLAKGTWTVEVLLEGTLVETRKFDVK